MKNLLWIKINDSFGFVGFSYGETIEDIDNDMPNKNIKKIFGYSWKKVWDMFLKLNNANYLTDETTKYMNSIGWFENDNFWKSNGDVHAHCFEKLENNELYDSNKSKN
jgi:hypothetical protein